MAVIADDWHAVQSSACLGCHKATSGAVPNVSHFLFAYLAGGQMQVCRWSDEGPRDEFYKKLVDAMNS